MEIPFNILRLLRVSALAGNISRNSALIRTKLRLEKRKIWPVAKVARLFGMSERLLWSWIKAGLLSTQKPMRFRKRGIANSEIKRFLACLKSASEGMDFDYVPVAGRPDHAMGKIRRTSFGNNGLTPRDFATKAGVSRASVMRAIHEGVLGAWQPSPRRYLTGRKPRLYAKNKKVKNNRLTR